MASKDTVLPILGIGITLNHHVLWLEFREYARNKYADEMVKDLTNIIKDLIERRRSKYERKNQQVGR